MNSYFVQQKFGIDSLKILKTLRIFHFLGEDFSYVSFKSNM